MDIVLTITTDELRDANKTIDNTGNVHDSIDLPRPDCSGVSLRHVVTTRHKPHRLLPKYSPAPHASPQLLPPSTQNPTPSLPSPAPPTLHSIFLPLARPQGWGSLHPSCHTSSCQRHTRVHQAQLLSASQLPQTMGALWCCQVRLEQQWVGCHLAITCVVPLFM